MTEWQTLTLRLTFRSPLQLGTESGVGTYEHTSLAIPGAVLRGAVAEALLKECTQQEHQQNHAACPERETCPFWQVFGADEPLWGFAYPAINGPAWPFPLTARTCKFYPGYEAGDGETYHGVYDTLIGQFVYDLLTDTGLPLREKFLPGLTGLADVGLLPTACPQCGAGLEAAQGIYTLDAENGPSYAGHLSVRRATHVGINRRRGVAEDALLFTQESIEPHGGSVAFHGRVTLPAAKVSNLHPYLHEREYWIGQGRSRGNGRVKLSVEAEKAAPLEERLSAFNNAFRATLRRVSDKDPNVQTSVSGTLFSLTLHSPLILEGSWQPVTVLKPEMIGLPGAALLRAWARPETVGGWDAAAQLPRRTRLAMQTGSVFLYWVPQALDEDLLTLLQHIEQLGLGEERARGYGQVAVCDPFHLFKRIEQQERSER